MQVSAREKNQTNKWEINPGGYTATTKQPGRKDWLILTCKYRSDQIKLHFSRFSKECAVSIKRINYSARKEMKVHFIYVNKPKYGGSSFKFTSYYLYYFRIPRFHSKLCFDCSWHVVGGVLSAHWGKCICLQILQRRAVQVSYRHFKLLRERSTFSQLRLQLSFEAFFFTLWMKKSFIVPANRITETYAEKIKTLSATLRMDFYTLFFHLKSEASPEDWASPEDCDTCHYCAGLWERTARPLQQVLLHLSCEIRSIEVVLWTGMVLLSTQLDFKLQGHYDQAWWRKVQSKMPLQSELGICLNTRASGCNGAVWKSICAKILIVIC